MRNRKIALPLISLLFGALCLVVLFINHRTAEAQKAIQKVYNSPLYKIGTSSNPLLLNSPDTPYMIYRKPEVNVRTIKKFTLQGDAATVIVQFRNRYSATDTRTQTSQHFGFARR